MLAAIIDAIGWPLIRQYAITPSFHCLLAATLPSMAYQAAAYAGCRFVDLLRHMPFIEFSTSLMLTWHTPLPPFRPVDYAVVDATPPCLMLALLASH